MCNPPHHPSIHLGKCVATSIAPRSLRRSHILKCGLYVKSFYWDFEMAFHILIQRSTPSLSKGFLFHFSGLFFTKNINSFLSGTAVPSQLGTATGPPCEDPCPQPHCCRPMAFFSDPFLFHNDRRKSPFFPPSWFGMKHIVSE